MTPTLLTFRHPKSRLQSASEVVLCRSVCEKGHKKWCRKRFAEVEDPSKNRSSEGGLGKSKQTPISSDPNNKTQPSLFLAYRLHSHTLCTRRPLERRFDLWRNLALYADSLSGLFRHFGQERVSRGLDVKCPTNCSKCEKCAPFRVRMPICQMVPTSLA